MGKTVISVKNLSKGYRIGTADTPGGSLFETAYKTLLQPVKRFRQLRDLTRLRNKEDKDIMWALRDITFEIKEGEIVGIVGRNGAGKTTLLKILSRITAPTDGAFELIGSVSSLLEVGTGFHPELTGRENIYLNGAVLGMRKREIDGSFNEIVNFSGVEKYLDTPVKRYSSGMRVRLAFSVAAYLKSDILLVDEVLAVGDIEFQKKCLGKMEEISKQSRTVFFVSHNIGTVRSICTKGIYLAHGRIKQMDDIDSVCNAYIRDIQSKQDAFSNDDVKVNIILKDEQDNKFKDWKYLEWMIIEVDVKSTQKINSPSIDLSFYSKGGTWIAALRSDMMTESLSGKDLYSFKMVFRIQNPGLLTSEVYLNVGVRNSRAIDRHGGDLHTALIRNAAVIPISHINLPHYHKTETICSFPAGITTEF